MRLRALEMFSNYSTRDDWPIYVIKPQTLYFKGVDNDQYGWPRAYQSTPTTLIGVSTAKYPYAISEDIYAIPR